MRYVTTAMESTRGWIRIRDRDAIRAYEVRKEPSPFSYSNRYPTFDDNKRAERDADGKFPSLTRQSIDVSSGTREFLSRADGKEAAQLARREKDAGPPLAAFSGVRPLPCH